MSDFTPKPMRFTVLPETWWQIYARALCNSRGQQTEAQEWQARIRDQKQLMRDLESTVYRNYVLSTQLQRMRP